MTAAAACGASTAGAAPGPGPAAPVGHLAAPPSTTIGAAPPGAEVITVQLATGSSSAIIRGSDDVGFSVERRVHHDGPEPPPSHRVEGRALVLEGCDLPDCWFEYEVAVPAWASVTGAAGSGATVVYGTAEVDIRTGSGSTSVASVAGPVRVEAGSGPVVLANIDGDITVDAGSGGVRGMGLSGDRAQVRTGSGGIELAFGEVQAIEATTGSGSVNLVVAPGRYRVSVESSDPPEIDVDEDPAAPATIDVRSASGDVSIAAGG